jgi:predicted DNA-binding ribbon-helix-helix protein
MKKTLALPAVQVSSSGVHGRCTTNSPVVKRSIVLVGHKTSVSLEDQFWDGLHEIAGNENMTISTLVEKIDTNRSSHNLSSAIRIFVLGHFRARTSQQIFPSGRPNPHAPTTSKNDSASGNLRGRNVELRGAVRC